MQVMILKARALPKELTHKGDIIPEVFFPQLLSRSCVKFMQEIVKNRTTGSLQ